MKLINMLLITLLLLLQHKLWVGEGGLTEVWRMEQAVKMQARENTAFKERNQALDAEVKDLKEGSDAIEERARSELGMIKKDETFYQVVN